MRDILHRHYLKTIVFNDPILKKTVRLDEEMASYLANGQYYRIPSNPHSAAPHALNWVLHVPHEYSCLKIYTSAQPFPLLSATPQVPILDLFKSYSSSFRTNVPFKEYSPVFGFCLRCIGFEGDGVVDQKSFGNALFRFIRFRKMCYMWKVDSNFKNNVCFFLKQQLGATDAKWGAENPAWGGAPCNLSVGVNSANYGKVNWFIASGRPEEEGYCFTVGGSTLRCSVCLGSPNSSNAPASGQIRHPYPDDKNYYININWSPAQHLQRNMTVGDLCIHICNYY
jgi:hypothetical protein